VSAALIIFATFSGLAVCICAVAGAILLANGKLTLPKTTMRRLQREKAALTIAEMRLERERVQTMHDAQIELRLRAALPPGEGDAHGS
jgi:hypothetical protein